MSKYIFTVFNSAISDFARNKVRTTLTSLGIMIGVMSVVLIIAFGLGLKKSISDQFDSLGSNQLVVFPGQVLKDGKFQGGSASFGSIRFDERDLQTIKRVEGMEKIAPLVGKSTQISFGGETLIGQLYMSSDDIFALRNLKLNLGELFTKEDVEKRQKVVVLGEKIVSEFFEDERDAIGKSIKVEGQTFKVIGTLKSYGSTGFGGPDFDTAVYLPYKAGYLFNPDKKFTNILLKGAVDIDTKELIKNTDEALQRRYKEDDFDVVELGEIQRAISDIFAILNLVLVGIATISLLVGGIGIMNIMYVTVSERTKEVGIRRALGARSEDILIQFLLEAVILSAFGGLIGLGMSFGIVEIVKKSFPAYIDLNSVIIALGVSSIIGVAFGVFPARKASQLSPIEAIRYE